MKRRFNETIDGSIQNIIQLKTLDNSLEFSQMYDALEDTPRDFQTKLIDALNSLGETMQIPPTEAFNKVLCKSDDKNEGLRKKLYNWWRAFFEVLGKVVGNAPADKSVEFNQKIDDLMAEIMKAGDAETSTEEEPVMESSTKPRFKKGDFVVVRNGDDARVLRAYRDRVDKSIWYEVWIMDGNRTTEFPDEDVYASRKEYEAKYLYEEEYEQATKDDEDKMMADMDFAIQHLGEIANKVKAIVNFINPYCEKTFNEENNTMKFKKIDEGSTEWVDAGEVFEMAKESDLEKKGEPLDEYEFIDLMKDDDDGDVFTVYDGTPMVDGSVCLNVIVNKDDTDNDEVKAEFGDWVEQYGWRYESFSFSSDLVGDEGTETINVYFRPIEKKIDETNLENELDKGDDGWVEIGQPVGESKPVELESGATKKVSLYVDWDDDGAGIDKNVVIDVPAEIADSEESTALYDYIVDWIDHQEFCVNDWAITDIEGLDNEVELEGTDWKDITEKLTAEELADSIDGWEDSSKNLVVANAYASGSDIVNVDVLTVTDKRDEVMKMANDYLLGNVENWQITDASEPRKDENGQFYTELILEPKYDEISENNDEVKTGDVKDGEKQVTQDGETKTLVAGEENKKPVCEMTIEQEIDDPWKLSELLWSQGKENLEELLRSELVGEEDIMQMLEDTGVRNLTNINDLFAFDFPSVLDSLGLDGQAWSKNLEFKRKEDNNF